VAKTVNAQFYEFFLHRNSTLRPCSWIIHEVARDRKPSKIGARLVQIHHLPSFGVVEKH
jgi:hypothetical protein